MWRTHRKQLVEGVIGNPKESIPKTARSIFAPARDHMNTLAKVTLTSRTTLSIVPGCHPREAHFSSVLYSWGFWNGNGWEGHGAWGCRQSFLNCPRLFGGWDEAWTWKVCSFALQLCHLECVHSLFSFFIWDSGWQHSGHKAIMMLRWDNTGSVWPNGHHIGP